MRPLTLTLKGFRGIRDGLGLDALTLDFEKLAGDAQLVALVGANGRGKSTIMDAICRGFINQVPELTAGNGIYATGGFIQEDQFGLMKNRHRKSTID